MTDFYEESYTILHSFYLYRKIGNKRFTLKLFFKGQTIEDYQGAPKLSIANRRDDFASSLLWAQFEVLLMTLNICYKRKKESNWPYAHFNESPVMKKLAFP